MRSPDLAEIKRRHPIAEVVAAYVNLKPSGRRWIGLCPLHEEQTPSFTVYPHSDSFYCFGCRQGGDVFHFIQQVERCSFREALHLLAGGRAFLQAFPGPNRTSPAKHTCGDTSHLAVLAAAIDLYQNLLDESPAGQDYLRRRAITQATARRCRLGIAGRSYLFSYLKWRRLSPERAVEIGLLRRDGSEVLTGRLIIPELRRGRPIWAIGRLLAGQEKGIPKYLAVSLPKPLLGLEAIQNHARFCVTEGAFCWLTAVQWGLPVCATLGTLLAPRARDELLQVAQPAARIYLLPQTDTPGQEAGNRLAALLGSKAQLVALPPEVKDLNELALLPDGARRLGQAIAAARSSSSAQSA